MAQELSIQDQPLWQQHLMYLLWVFTMDVKLQSPFSGKSCIKDLIA